jgi:glycosyltransferase involved in cell wall biosynthesis
MSAPIRVCWVVKGLGPGGAERLLVSAASAHDRDMFEFEVVYLLPWKDHLVAELTALGVRCTCLGVRTEYDLRWAARLRALLMARLPDVVHMHSPYAASVTRLVVRTLPSGVRPALVSTEHNPWRTFKTPTRYANALTAPLDDVVFAVSNETRDSMWSLRRKRTEVLVHGIDVAAVKKLRAERDDVRRELGVDTAMPLVGTVANYHPKKDWPNLLHAARLLADRGVELRVCAVGQGPLEDNVKALHRELHLDDVVTLTGYRPDAARLMAGCDVFALSSRWEGLPVALMEASALGLPIVATRVGGVADTFHDGIDAVLVPPGSPRALADGIERVIEDPLLRARLHAAASAHAVDFEIERAANRIESVYRSLVER